jgi:IS5 family transposase
MVIVSFIVINQFVVWLAEVGLLLLKQLENLSDERVVLQFKRNPYYQYFCGYPNYIPDIPCNATELVQEVF